MIKNRFTKKELKKLKPTIGQINDIVIVGENFHFNDPKRTNRLVLITGGQYESNGRLSNSWTWKDVNSDGTLGKQNSGYGNFYKPKETYFIKTKIIKK
jgi:hypothetical protein